MIINVKVKPRSSKQEIECLGDSRYLIYLKSEPENNKANIEMIKLLSRHFGIIGDNFNFCISQKLSLIYQITISFQIINVICYSAKNIKIKFGAAGKIKVIEVL